MSQTSCARRVKVFIVVTLCEVGLWDDSSSNLSVCVGFLYTVVRSSFLSRLTKQSGKGSFPFSSISLVNCFSSVRLGGHENRQFRLNCERR